MRQSIDYFNKLLKEHDLSITPNRLKILDCLQDELHFHTINDIVSHIKDINLKSLYNNIHVLIEAKIIEVYSFDGISKYALADHFSAHGKNQIHLVEPNNAISHVELTPQIAKLIEKHVNKNGQKIKHIKIFVELEDDAKSQADPKL